MQKLTRIYHQDTQCNNNYYEFLTINLNIRDCKSGPYGECKGSQNILYAWAKDAPPKFLPKGECGIIVFTFCMK